MKLVIYTTLDSDPDIGVVKTIYGITDGLPDEIISKGIEVESIPVPEILPKKAHILYIRLSTKELFYEYVDRHLTKEEQVEKRITDLELLIAETYK